MKTPVNVTSDNVTIDLANSSVLDLQPQRNEENPPDIGKEQTEPGTNPVTNSSKPETTKRLKNL